MLLLGAEKTVAEESASASSSDTVRQDVWFCFLLPSEQWFWFAKWLKVPAPPLETCHSSYTEKVENYWSSWYTLIGAGGGERRENKHFLSCLFPYIPIQPTSLITYHCWWEASLRWQAAVCIPQCWQGSVSFFWERENSSQVSGMLNWKVFN